MRQYKLTRAQFEAIRTKLAGEGFVLIGDSGSITAQHVQGSFQYSENIGHLAITITKKPFIVAESWIWSKIDAQIAQVGGAPA